MHVFHIVLDDDELEDIERLIKDYSDKWSTVPMSPEAMLDFIVSESIKDAGIQEALLNTP